MRGVGDELAQMLLVLAQAGLGGDAGREGGLDPLEHDVEGTGQTADLGRLVGAGDALVEIAGGDGVGGPLDVLERAQAEPDQPPATGQGQDERSGRHGELGQEEGVQRAGLVDERLRLHGDVGRSAPSPPAPGTAGPPDAMDEVVKYTAWDPSGWVVKPVIGEGSWGR